METLREADTACRLDDGRFRDGARGHAGERRGCGPWNGCVRRMADQHRDLTMWGGAVACYPGARVRLGSDHRGRRRRALTAGTRLAGRNRIEVATVLDD